MKKFWKILYRILLWGFAVVGLGLSIGYLAITNQWTNDSGTTDFNNRKFQEVAAKESHERDSTGKLLFKANEIAQIAYKLMIIEKYFPQNASTILREFEKTGDFEYANKMIQAVNIRTTDSIDLEKEFKAKEEIFMENRNLKSKNLFEWIDLVEWQALKEAIKKDKKLIDSAAKVCGVEPRMIATCLIGEQIRLFKSDREIFKTVLKPLKILSVGNYISFGVTGIKDFTAIAVENNLKNPSSKFYLGPKYENLINFQTADPATERMNNLVNYKNHYYSYLYAGLIVRQIREQWKREGYDISYRPEILATLFNVGFGWSKPKPNPVVGGSHIVIGEKTYTFGGIGYEFYYSGELTEEFPYSKVKWTEL
jgi:hypothetical protein